jgi:hypothetical protein
MGKGGLQEVELRAFVSSRQACRMQVFAALVVGCYLQAHGLFGFSSLKFFF